LPDRVLDHDVTADDLKRLLNEGRMFTDTAITASVLRCDRRTVRAMCRRGEIPCTMTGAEFRIPVAWLAERAGVTA
jgi:excisionase family DNA binding protein